MYRIAEGSTCGLQDVEAFVRLLSGLKQQPVAPARGLFDATGPLHMARAPGRLDVMGGIADYSGSLVLQLPIREATIAALQRRPERVLRIVSLGEEAGRSHVFEMPLTDFEAGGPAATYESARAYFRGNPATHWAGYAAGAFLVLMRERQTRFAEGASILITSAVPEGKGVSSSAAIEVAVTQAVAAAYGIRLDPRELAILCQKVENLVVGAPCGVMDQMTASCGQAGRLMALLCQPAELRDPVELPAEVEVWGLDSGIRHSVSGADYGSVRVGAFMGYRIIADLAGLPVDVDASRTGFVHIPDSRWHGYLANITPEVFERQFAAELPEMMNGGEFVTRYGGTTDPVTHVDPNRGYAIRMPTAHPIYEHSRVQEFAKLLAGEIDDRSLTQLGELMYQSHASYSACGLGCSGTDLLVDLVRQAGPAKGLFGAKITGGGSGGTVAVLGRRGAGGAIRSIAEEYERLTGYRPYVFSGSSPGAAAFGHLKLLAE